MLACYAETDSLYLESLSADGVRQFASFGTGDDDSLEASPEDIREFCGKSCLGFSDVVSLLGILSEPAETGLRQRIGIRVHSN